MEAIEDDERNEGVRDNFPGKMSVVLCVYGRGIFLLHLEGVEGPQGEIGEKQKGD